VGSIALTLRGALTNVVREGASFRRVLADLESHQNYGQAEICKHQESALAEVFRWCRASRFYAAAFPAGDPPPGRALERLAAVTPLEKETLRRRNAEFRAGGLHGMFAHEGHTSGTTGTPIHCWRDGRAIVFENAALWRVFRWSGLALGDRRAVLRGDLVVPAARREPPYWARTAPHLLALSSYHLAPQNLPLYADALRRFAPAAIQAYPSSAALVASWFVERGETLPLKAVLTSSETLLDSQRELLEKAFRAPVIDYYGNAERTAMIARCEKGAYHVMWDYAVTEFLDGEEGGPEIVGTPLMNRAMPLLRYRSGDRVQHGPVGERCPCGRTFPVCGRPEGRRDVYILTPDGRRIGRMDHVFKGLEHIREAQIVQTAIDRIVLRIAPDPLFGEEHEKRLVRQTSERVGADVTVAVEIVEKIPRGPGGKFAAIVSEIGAREPAGSGGAR